MVSVHSKAIKSVSHSKGKEILRVVMRDGTEHQYKDVPRSTYKALLDAPSVGQFFNLYIRDEFPHEVL